MSRVLRNITNLPSSNVTAGLFAPKPRPENLLNEIDAVEFQLRQLKDDLDVLPIISSKQQFQENSHNCLVIKDLFNRHRDFLLLDSLDILVFDRAFNAIDQHNYQIFLINQQKATLVAEGKILENSEKDETYISITTRSIMQMQKELAAYDQKVKRGIKFAPHVAGVMAEKKETLKKMQQAIAERKKNLLYLETKIAISHNQTLTQQKLTYHKSCINKLIEELYKNLDQILEKLPELKDYLTAQKLTLEKELTNLHQQLHKQFPNFELASENENMQPDKPHKHADTIPSLNLKGVDGWIPAL